MRFTAINAFYSLFVSVQISVKNASDTTVLNPRNDVCSNGPQVHIIRGRLFFRHLYFMLPRTLVLSHHPVAPAGFQRCKAFRPCCRPPAPIIGMITLSALRACMKCLFIFVLTLENRFALVICYFSIPASFRCI